MIPDRQTSEANPHPKRIFFLRNDIYKWFKKVAPTKETQTALLEQILGLDLKFYHALGSETRAQEFDYEKKAYEIYKLPTQREGKKRREIPSWIGMLVEWNLDLDEKMGQMSEELGLTPSTIANIRLQEAMEEFKRNEKAGRLSTKPL